MKLKEAWDSGLIQWVAGITAAVGSAMIWIATLVLTQFVDARIDIHKPANIVAAESKLEVNSSVLQSHTTAINGLSTDIRSLDDDVRAMLIIASGSHD